jgi:hypothetical protein
MPQRNQIVTGPLSAAAMAERLGLSRRRFYEVLKAGKFPPPVYRLDNRKPFYPPEVQKQCLNIRETGEALDGTIILFNRPRERRTFTGATRSARAAATAPAVPPIRQHVDLIAYLSEHGLTVTDQQVSAAIVSCFPGGTEGTEQGHVWREVFRHLRQQNRTGTAQ